MPASKLSKYNAKRDFKVTSEPAGKTKRSAKGFSYLIQKHEASHLHYDFRLEVDGVLKSWAVPKGLPEKMGIRRLAIPTDDHPMEYADFEGIIPEGHYGGGTVMVWDIGTYENIKYENNKLVPMDKCWDRGTIEVMLNGKKLHAAYALIRTKGFTNKESWILLKMKVKPESKKRTKKPIRKDVSALTGRTMKKIADDHDAEWE